MLFDALEGEDAKRRLEAAKIVLAKVNVYTEDVPKILRDTLEREFSRRQRRNHQGAFERTGEDESPLLQHSDNGAHAPGGTE